jgi:hypothetical protein
MSWHDDQRLSFLLLAAAVRGEGYSSRCWVRLPDSITALFINMRNREKKKIVYLITNQDPIRGDMT